MSEVLPTLSDRELLQTFLRERDVACPRCEYNLRNLVGDRCPECGDELVLRVNLSEPKMAAFLTGLIGLAAGAGFSGLLILYMVIVSLLMQRGGGFWGMFLAVTATGFVVMGMGVWFWIRGRKHIRRLPQGRQWILAAGCWCLTLANLIIFTKAIR